METKKRIYVGLLAGSLLVLLLLTGLLWYLVSTRELMTSQILLSVLLVLVAVLLVIMLIGIMAITVMIIRSKSIPPLENVIRLVNEWLFPITLMVGKITGIPRDKILRSFISVNNYLVSSKKVKVPENKIMILVPHCLQNSDCPHKITIDVNNCRECGRCKIGELKKIAREHQAILKVATGGTLARKFIKENCPEGVVAVACERDLSLGIQDTAFLPIIGVLNCRPYGPCVNTDVSIEAVLDAFNIMSKGG
ncbi:DUF116 domain-containing protein [Syntrophomonas erecta]